MLSRWVLLSFRLSTLLWPGLLLLTLFLKLRNTTRKDEILRPVSGQPLGSRLSKLLSSASRHLELGKLQASCYFVIARASAYSTASLAQWLRRPPRERKVPGSNPACAGIFSGSSHTSDFKTGTPVATLPGAWRYRVSTGTGRPGVSIL